MTLRQLIFIYLLLCLATVAAQEPSATDSLGRTLEEVVVTARQPATRLEGTTLISTIPGTPLQNLGTALDVLGQLPMISVRDNDVSVVGKGSPEIYIDGRPMRDADELTRLLSSDLKRVELLMVPGPMYDSSTGAVLKITTRRNFLKGLSVTENAMSQWRREWSGHSMTDVSYRAGRWELFASGNISRHNSRVKGSTVNSLLYDGRETVIGSRQDSRHPSVTGVVRGGINYADTVRSAGAYYRYNPERGDFLNSGSEWMDNQSPFNRDISRRIRARSHLVSAYYDDTFGGKYHFHFDGDYRVSSSRNNVSTIYPEAEADDVSSADRRRSSLLAGRAYISFPLFKGDFTAGVSASHTRSRLDFRMIDGPASSYIPSTLTDARQTSAAAYALWDRNFGRLSLSAGLRYEFTDYTFFTDGVRDRDLSRTDHTVSPDLSIGYHFSDDSQLSLSYKMATVRPPYSQLTGSLSYTGIHEIEGGNPSLRDERMNSLQLLGTWRGFMIQGVYTRSSDTYGFVKRLYPAPTLQLLMQPVNLDVSSLDLYLVWSGQTGVWSPSVTAGMHRQWLDIEGQSYNRPIFSYYLENMFSLPHGFTVTANVSGQSSGDMHTNRFGATWATVDASVSRSFFNRSLQVSLTATDIFNTFNSDWTMDTYGIHVDKRQSYDNRGIKLSVIYRFQPRKSSYKGSSAAQSELNHL